MADDTASIDEVVTVETRLDDDRFRVGEELFVDASSLASISPGDSERLFRTLPGFSVNRPGGPGGVSEVFLRGAESNFTAVYVDGVRLNNPSNTRGGSFDYSSLGIFDIERIDISAGAMSAVYGADAMAGVVFIRSAWADPGAPSIFLEAGSVDDWRISTQASFSIGEDTEWGVRASSVDGGNEIAGSSLNQKSFSSRLVGSFADGGLWRVSLRQVTRDRSSFPEVSGGPELAVNRTLETADGDDLSIAAEGRWTITDDWETDLTITGGRIRDESAVPAVAPGLLDGQPAFSSDTNYQRAQLLWVNRISLSDDLDLVAGADLVSEDGSDNGAVDLGFTLAPNTYELNRSTSSAFAELGKRWNDRLTTSVAGRWDRFGDKSRFSGKLGVTRVVSDTGSQIWARAATGFKLPSFFSLGNPLFGNPDLVAEEVKSAEIGYTHEPGDTNRVSVSLFKSQYDNLVDFDFETFSSVNRGRIDVHGIEIRSTHAVSETARIAIDATISDISGVSGALRNRPEHTGGASLIWSPPGDWRFNVTARYVGARLITSIPTGDVDASGYAIFGATARYERSADRTFWVALDNAFDEDYQDAPGFPSPGLRLRVGANLTF
jgi:outer membrane cobalamin receptor